MGVAVSRRRFTADEYQRMAEAGILRREDRVELIEGEIVAMSPIGPRHAASTDRLARVFVTQLGDTAIVRVQGAVQLDMFNQPQPDLVVLKPREDFYASAHPGPRDMLLVIEVADTSASHDRRVKAPLYARLGIQEYWLADLKKGVVTCYRAPEGGAYTEFRHIPRGQTLTPLLLPSCTIPTNELLLPS